LETIKQEVPSIMISKRRKEIIEGLITLGTVIYPFTLACYMNSFLQSLYMTIEFRKAVLSVSTL
jgi:hypothetical protein